MALQDFKKENSNLIQLLPYIKGNVELIFFKEDIEKVKEIVMECRNYCPAVCGDIAPSDVIVPRGPTWLEPTRTAYFAALNVPSKISKGVIEIISDVHLLQKGEKIGKSQESFLRSLGMKPFIYQPKLGVMYIDGFIYNSSRTEPSYLMNIFQIGVQNIASLCLAIGYPTEASLIFRTHNV